MVDALAPELAPPTLDRARGCLLGQLVGDSLGSLVEFMPAAEIARRYPGGVRALADGGPFSLLAGQPTDDSELALALARALLAADGFDVEVVARAYAGWLASDPFDVGGTTHTALAPAAAALARGEAVAGAAMHAATASHGSEANGALMRVSPLGVFGWRMPADELAELARVDAALTHPSPVCRDASALFVVCIAHAIAQAATPLQLFEFARRWAVERGLHADVVACVIAAEQGPPAEFQRSMGWVRIALHNAFFQLRTAASFEAGLVDTVMRGGDTDTNGAIAGALLGAVHGREAIPLAWREGVLACRPLAGLAGVRRPRPPEYWPVDAERIAEQLLVVGTRGTGA
jgi:ADP-ribosylglycohydrolase